MARPVWAWKSRKAAPLAAFSFVPAGNHVILSCGGLNVELAHLRQGSITRVPGEQVKAGPTIGAVGNSRNSTEPHLHIHAIDTQSGQAAEIGFEGVKPIRNTKFER